MFILKTATALLVLAVAAGSSVQGDEFQGEISERIYGGRLVKEGEIPYMVDLHLNNEQDGVLFCGGALISNKWIMTTATCAQYNGYGEASIGETSLEVSKFDVKDLTPPSIFHPHPKFNASTKENDIGLIELPTAVNLSAYPHIKPIDLPSKSMSPASYFDNYNASISGKGRYTLGLSRSPEELRSAFVKVMKKADCVSKMASYPNKPYPLTDNELCAAKDPSDHKYGACVGDYGGPMAVQNPSTGKPMLIGVMSFTANGFTNGKCFNEYPGISTFVVPYLDWIFELTGISVS